MEHQIGEILRSNLDIQDLVRPPVIATQAENLADFIDTIYWLITVGNRRHLSKLRDVVLDRRGITSISGQGQAGET